MSDRKPHLASLIKAVDVLCGILEKWYPVLATYMDAPELVALAALKVACENFHATLPVQDS